MPKRFRIRLPREDKIKTALVQTAGLVTRVNRNSIEDLGPLLEDVQTASFYGDGKKFVDLVPKNSTKYIQKKYLAEKELEGFNLESFLHENFDEYTPPGRTYDRSKDKDVSEHISHLWDVLKRRNRVNRGSLFALPHEYIVPGGRFSEQYYWDSYFIMLGLAADERWGDIEKMVKNFTYMIRKFGFIPTANRTYYLSRSQPPFFSAMVKLLASHNGKLKTYSEHLPYLLAEYRFWSRGRRNLVKREHRAYARLVLMPDGALLNRYYDNKTTPRPESLKEDVATAESAEDRDSERLFLHLRAAAESGWDFSSRWFLEENDISSIHTADILPVDLNCLLYQQELLIAETYRLLKNPLLANKFYKLAQRRASSIQKYFWNPTLNFYCDYNFHYAKSTERLTLAGMFPLYAGIASHEQAQHVARRVEELFLMPGGLVTTNVNSSQQWDSPNGWAPLQWISIIALRNYGYHALANEIKNRWIKSNEDVFTRDARLVEKYNVIDTNQLGGGGEYSLQDGFGWTNGVLAALLAE